LPQLSTSYERDGFDGTHGDSVWWFESWGDGPKQDWTVRGNVGRPPTPRELRRAYYIVIGIRHANGSVTYRTHTGGLDLEAKLFRHRRAR